MATTTKGKRRRKINRLGINPAEARLRHLLFRGKRPKWAAQASGLPLKAAAKILAELVEAGCGPKTTGPYTVTQAAKVLGLQVRRTRTLCCQGRIGWKSSEYLYLISREDLERFGSQERRSGVPGQRALAREILHSNGKSNGAARR